MKVLDRNGEEVDRGEIKFYTRSPGVIDWRGLQDWDRVYSDDGLVVFVANPEMRQCDSRWPR